MKYLYTLFLVFSSFYSFSQVGINTTNPTSTLDINGDLRIRSTPISATTKDVPLVVNSQGIIKRNLTKVIGLYRGRLVADFDSGPKTPLANDIYKIDNIGMYVDPNNDFDNATDVFTAPITGVYEVTITLSIKGNLNPKSNYVTGIYNVLTEKWVMRYSMQKEEFDASPANAGVTRTFTGVARLGAGNQYSFGFAGGDFTLLAFPSGSSGSGIGSYLKIELLDNN